MAETRSQKVARLQQLKAARQSRLTGQQVRRGRDSDGSEAEFFRMSDSDIRRQDEQIAALEKELYGANTSTGSARFVW